MILVNNCIMKKILINRNKSGIYFTKKQILKFEKPDYMLSDEDILNLLMGFVKLIKKSTQIEVENRYLMQIRKLQSKLKKFENS